MTKAKKKRSLFDQSFETSHCYKQLAATLMCQVVRLLLNFEDPLIKRQRRWSQEMLRFAHSGKIHTGRACNVALNMQEKSCSNSNRGKNDIPKTQNLQEFIHSNTLTDPSFQNSPWSRAVPMQKLVIDTGIQSAVLAMSKAPLLLFHGIFTFDSTLEQQQRLEFESIEFGR